MARVIVLLIGIVFLLVGVMVAADMLLQVKPTTTSVKTWSWENYVGQAEYRGTWPQTQGFTATATSSPHTGISIRLFSSQPAGAGSWAISYEVRCGGLLRGAGSTSFAAYWTGAVGQGSVWLTIIATSSTSVVAANDACALVVSVTGGPGGPGALLWEWRGTPKQGHAVVWGEPYTLPPPGEEPPPPPPPPPTEQPPSDPIVEEDEPASPTDDGSAPAIGDAAAARLLIGAVLVVVGVVFIVAATRMG